MPTDINRVPREPVEQPITSVRYTVPFMRDEVFIEFGCSNTVAIANTYIDRQSMKNPFATYGTDEVREFATALIALCDQEEGK